MNLQTPQDSMFGNSPEWSHDGKRIAFVKSSLDDTKEVFGIASLGFDSDGDWKWLYEPIPRDDKYYFPPNNILIRDDYAHRLLSWSPDDQYIAFVNEAALGACHIILRLNVFTGEIVSLTSTIGVWYEEGFLAPAWGP